MSTTSTIALTDEQATYLSLVANIETVDKAFAIDADIAQKREQAESLLVQAKAIGTEAKEEDKEAGDIRADAALACFLLLDAKVTTGQELADRYKKSQAYISSWKKAGQVMARSEKCLAIKDGEPTKGARAARRKVFGYVAGREKVNQGVIDGWLKRGGDPVDVLQAVIDDEAAKKRAAQPSPIDALAKKGQEFVARVGVLAAKASTQDDIDALVTLLMTLSDDLVTTASTIESAYAEAQSASVVEAPAESDAA